jgi:hypothetical protein
VLFLGRLHPLLVHLPIGLIILLATLEAVSRTTDFGWPTATPATSGDSSTHIDLHRNLRVAAVVGRRIPGPVAAMAQVDGDRDGCDMPADGGILSARSQEGIPREPIRQSRLVNRLPVISEVR